MCLRLSTITIASLFANTLTMPLLSYIVFHYFTHLFSSYMLPILMYVNALIALLIFIMNLFLVKAIQSLFWMIRASNDTACLSLLVFRTHSIDRQSS